MIVKSKENNRNIFELTILAIIFILNESCFYLVDLESINLSGAFNYDDIPLILSIVWSLYVLIKYRGVKVKKYIFRYEMLFIFVLVILSSIRGQQLYGQSMLLGIRPQRFFLVFFLLYFPLIKFLYADERNRISVEKIIYRIGIVALVMYTTQYFLISKIMFLYVPESSRYGGTRLHFDSTLLSLLFFFVLEKLFQRKEVTKNTIIMSLLIFYNIFIIRGRLAILALLFSSIVMILLWKKNLLIKIPIIIFGILALGFLLMTPLLSQYASILDKNTRSVDENNIIRELGKENYLRQLKNSPITGRGYINQLNEKAYEAAGIGNKYYLNDNGITAFVFMYGILGGAWVISLFIKMYIYGVRIYNKQNKYIYIAYIIYLTVLLPNILQFYWGWGPLYTIIIMCNLEIDLEKGRIRDCENKLSDNNIVLKMEEMYGI